MGKKRWMAVLLIMPVFLFVCLSGCRSLNTLPAMMPALTAQKDIFLPVIMYHSVIDNAGKAGDYIITPERFASDMTYLQQNGYQTVFVADILAFMDYGVPLPEKPVLVTFDDGHYNIKEYLLPIMQEMDLKAIVNVEGAFTEQSTQEQAHNPNYSYLTWEEISELQDSGYFEIGNHTYDMHDASGERAGCKINPGESEEDYAKVLEEDIGGLQELLTDRCATTPVTFAYPYGFISDESVPVLQAMGFRVLLTCYEQPNYLNIAPESSILLHRYNRPGNVSTEQFMEKLLRQEA
ncbi:MAG: polysaccharide deacetylase family protein [Oscillospiraceae bacterium]|nr:polysaccharide deacetylase family protein [Oscillospiraceae bacterium]